ncbi:MAG: MaoC/PaaZ C-terminal domain-containing protein [Myxococcota bacterium]
MSRPVVIPSMSAARHYQGTELGATEWVTIDQARIDGFAAATGDTRWIHVDPERAAVESPWKSTIADGLLLLSLIPDLLPQLIVLIGWSKAINTGVDHTEFPGVVTAGSRVRLGARLARARVLPNGCRLGFDAWFDIEGSETPGCRTRVNYAYFE